MSFSYKFFLTKKWLRLNKWLLLLGILIICLSVILIWQPGFIAGAVDAMRIPYAVGLTIFTVFFFIRDKKVLATSGALALLILVPGIWPYFKPEQRPAQTNKNEIKSKMEIKADFSVAHYNVKENNKKIMSVVKNAVESDADIISFQELRDVLLSSIDSVIVQSHPYSISDLSIPGYGMAVYSKYPIQNSEVIINKNFPVLYGVLQVKNRYVHFISATTATPTNEKDYIAQMQQFKLMAEYSNRVDSPLIVMGDMNAVPWSTQITEFLKNTDLKDSRKDLSGTFPSQSLFVKIPIDYIFHSPELFCEAFKTTGNTSSNHLGIVGYYSFKKVKRPY